MLSEESVKFEKEKVMAATTEIKSNDALSKRIFALESALICEDNENMEEAKYDKEDGQTHEALLRSRLAASNQHQLYSAKWHWVPANVYYSEWKLEQRCEFLKAPSIHALCKSMLMEYLPSRFVLCIVQYTSALDTKLISSSIRQRIFNKEEKAQYTKLDIKVASSEDNDRLTGYLHNAVTPIGMTCQDQIPILLSSSIPSKRMFVGGGHPFCKLSVLIEEFARKVPNVHVVDISTTRTSYEETKD